MWTKEHYGTLSVPGKIMNQAQIIGLTMYKTGVRGPEFARQKKIRKASLYDVAKGKSKNHRVRKIISETVELTEQDLWPIDAT